MVIDVCPEFGYEIACAIPYAYWLHQRGELEKVITCKGMKPFYFFCSNVEERYSSRSINNSANGIQNLPNTWIHHNALAVFGKDRNDLDNPDSANGILDYRQWVSPPYREFYSKNKIDLGKPTIVISNRYNIEHGMMPRGYFDIECLYTMFNYFTENGFAVIYKRPKNTEFAIDENEQHTLSLNINIHANVNGIGSITDYELTKYYDDVYLLDDLVDKHQGSYNEIQLRLFANASGFVSMAGGTGILCSCFGVPNITYVTTSGELRPNYFQEKSYYRMLSNAPIYPIVDPETEISKRGYHNYEEIFNTIKTVFK